MSNFWEKLEKAKREGIPKAKPVEDRRPKAEVVALPKGPALALAKEDRTRAGEIDRAFARAARRPPEAVAVHMRDRPQQRCVPVADGYLDAVRREFARQPRRLDANGDPVRRETSNDYDLFKGI